MCSEPPQLNWSAPMFRRAEEDHGRYDAAAFWGGRAAHAPAAGNLIAMLAILMNGLAGNRPEATAWAKRRRILHPDLTQAPVSQLIPVR